jgi:MFS transporter, MHS family, proline/betaine transporter
MALVTAGMGMLPGYDSIGWLAPVLLVLLRTGQGAAAGGEFGGSAALGRGVRPAGPQRLVRRLAVGDARAGPGRRDRRRRAPQCGPARIGARSWGWRLPLLLALPLGLVGLYIRLRLEETPGFRAVQQVGGAARAPLADTLRTAWRQVAVGFGIVAAVTSTFNIFYVFLPSHLAASGRAPLSRALAGAFVGLLVGAAVAPVAGRISDRMGRRPVLRGGAVALLLVTAPACWLIQRGATGGLVLGYAAMGLVLGVLALSSFLAELFPTRLRYSGLSLSFGLASPLFGGTAPVLATALVGRTGDALPAAWYASAVTAIAIACVLAAPETVRQPLHEET